MEVFWGGGHRAKGQRGKEQLPTKNSKTVRNIQVFGKLVNPRGERRTIYWVPDTNMLWERILTFLELKTAGVVELIQTVERSMVSPEASEKPDRSSPYKK